MAHRSNRQASRRLLMSLAGMAAGFTIGLQPAVSEEAATKAAPSAGQSGMTVYIDPQTGAIRSEPAPNTQPLTLSPQEQNALSSSQEGLVQVPVPGGGYKIDLQGRFQSPLIGTIDPKGNVKMQHLGEPDAKQ